MNDRHPQVNTAFNTAGCSDAPFDLSNAEAFEKCVNEVSVILEKLPASFSGTFEYHLKKNRVTTNKLAELTYLSTASITRYRTDNNVGRKLSVVVLICLALKLNVIFSFDLIRKAGFSFNCSIEHIAYQTLLLASGTLTNEQCNEYLTSIGLKPLNK